MPLIRINDCLNCHIKHEWLFNGMTLMEWRNVQKLTGFTQQGFAKAADDGDPEATAAMLWVLHKRSKINVSFDDVDVDFNDFSMEATPDEIAAMKADGLLDDDDPKETLIAESGPTSEAVL